MKTIDHIPSLDLQDLSTCKAERKEAFIHEIGLASQEIAYVALIRLFHENKLNEELCKKLSAVLISPMK